MERTKKVVTGVSIETGIVEILKKRAVRDGLSLSTTVNEILRKDVIRNKGK